jgi:hypothetical protein
MNQRIKVLWTLQPIFQRKAWEARQCVTESGSLCATPEKVTCEAMKVKPQLQWRPQNVGDVRNAANSLVEKVQVRGKYGLQMPRLYAWGFLNLMEFPSCHCMPGSQIQFYSI